jgi:hypothetical protein
LNEEAGSRKGKERKRKGKYTYMALHKRGKLNPCGQDVWRGKEVEVGWMFGLIDGEFSAPTKARSGASHPILNRTVLVKKTFERRRG